MASAEPTQADIPPTTPDIDTQAKTETETESETETAKPSPDKVNDALTTLHTRLAQTLKDVDYNECFGVTLDPSDLSHGPTRMVLRKWLNSTNNDVDAALSNLTNTLKWRKEFKPLDCIHQTHPNKFDGLGYITRNLIQGQQAVVTWSVTSTTVSLFVSKSHRAGTSMLLPKTWAKSLATSMRAPSPLHSKHALIASGVLQISKMARRSDGTGYARTSLGSSCRLRQFTT